MAVGLTLAVESFAAFRQAFDIEIRRWLHAEDLHGRLLSDGELAPAHFCLETAEHLSEAGPWGQGFPEPLFDGVFTIVSHRVLKEPVSYTHLDVYKRQLPTRPRRLLGATTVSSAALSARDARRW